MPNQQLLDYIRQETEKGQSKDQIKQGLSTAGWPEADINEAFSAVESPNAVPVPSAAAPGFEDGQQKGKFLGPIELLKRSWQIYKARFWVLIAITITPMAVIFLFGGLIAIAIIMVGGVADNFMVILPLILLGLIAALAALVLQFWGQIASLYVIKGGLEEKVGIKEAFRRAWPKIWSYWWVGFLAGMVTMGGLFLFIIPGLLFAVWYGMAAYVLINEDTKGLNALIKSKIYTQGHWWGIVGRGLVVTAIFFAAMIPVIILSAALDNETFFSLINNTLQLLLAPFALAYGFSMYKSLKEAKGEFEFKPTGKGWLIALAIFGGLIIPIAIIAGMVVVNMSSGADAAKNAKIQSYMDQIRSSAAAYIYNPNNENGYLGLEEFSDYALLYQKITDVNESGFQAQIYKDSYCVKAELVQAKEATSYSQGGDYWCIDSNGYSGAINGDEYCTTENPYCPESSSYPVY